MTPPIWKRPVFGYLAAVVVLALGTSVLAAVPLHGQSAAPLFLLGIVIVALTWGTGPALFASLCAALSYSYFFMRPVGFTITSGEDWVALITFTLSAVFVGELAARTARRQDEARAGRREIERLYQELQSAFERASEAEAARRNEQLKAALLDALTHNLRTPLTGIKAAVTALLGAIDRPHDAPLPAAAHRELLQVIDEESDRLNRFISGLGTSRPAEQSEPATLKTATIDDVVRSGLARAEAITRDHLLTVSVPPGLPKLAIDPAAIAEVIYILLDNASKYAPVRTTIGVAARRHDERHAVLEISDEGPGIPSPLRERVFDRFFRIPGREPADPNRSSVGLGLSIARRLVEAQGGRIWIESSRSRRGTAVVMMLPFAAAVPEPSPMIETAAGGG